MDTKTCEIEIPASLLDSVFPRERLARRHEDHATPAELIADAVEAASIRESCAVTSEFPAIEESPIVVVCDDCGGDGEVYSRDHYRAGHPSGLVRCATCHGEGHVPAMCEMIGCGRQATSDDDGVRLCDEHAPHAVCDICGGKTDNGTFLAAGTETTACDECQDKAARAYLSGGGL